MFSEKFSILIATVEIQCFTFSNLPRTPRCPQRDFPDPVFYTPFTEKDNKYMYARAREKHREDGMPNTRALFQVFSPKKSNKLNE